MSSLNLVLCDHIANCTSQAKIFFGVIQRLYVLFSSSPQRWKILEENVGGLTLKPLSQTRWESQIESIKALRCHVSKIRDALVDLSNQATDMIAKNEAKSLVTHELETFQFLLSVVIWNNLLLHVNYVSKSLLSEDIHTDIAMEQFKGLITYFERYREVGFEEALVEATKMAGELGIEPKMVEKRIIRRTRQFDEKVGEDVSALELFRLNYFLFIVDQAIFLFKYRLDSNDLRYIKLFKK